jgi:hypothetical protein
MITYTDTTCTIKCDKCGHEETAPKGTYNDQFSNSNWIMKSSARKYTHRCQNCLTKSEKKAQAFVKEAFPVTRNKPI